MLFVLFPLLVLVSLTQGQTTNSSISNEVPPHDIRDEVFKNLLWSESRHQVKLMKEATPACRQAIIKSQGALAKTCMPAIEAAMKEAPLTPDILEMMEQIILAMVRGLGNHKCYASMLTFHATLKKAGCHDLTLKVRQDIKYLKLGTMLKRFREVYQDRERLLQSIDEAQTPICRTWMEELGKTVQQEMTDLGCPTLGISILRVLDVYSTIKLE